MISDRSNNTSEMEGNEKPWNCECEKAQFLERDDIFLLRIDQAAIKYRSSGCDSCTNSSATVKVLDFNQKYENTI